MKIRTASLLRASLEEMGDFYRDIDSRMRYFSDGRELPLAVGGDGAYMVMGTGTAKDIAGRNHVRGSLRDLERFAYDREEKRIEDGRILFGDSDLYVPDGSIATLTALSYSLQDMGYWLQSNHNGRLLFTTEQRKPSKVEIYTDKSCKRPNSTADVGSFLPNSGCDRLRKVGGIETVLFIDPLCLAERILADHDRTRGNIPVKNLQDLVVLKAYLQDREDEYGNNGVHGVLYKMDSVIKNGKCADPDTPARHCRKS